MVIHTIPDKSNTIFRGSKTNHGLHPISMLMYGNENSRILIHFKIDDIISCCSDVPYTHHLKMINCGSVDDSKNVFSNTERATSFTVMAVKIDGEWDEGVGFDKRELLFDRGEACVSTEGSNWFYRQNLVKWAQNGFMDDSTLRGEYNKYIKGEKSIIIGIQHFDHGNENLDIDVTDFVNSLITSEVKKRQPNYGICLAFIPDLEDVRRDVTQYVGFFNEKTNTRYVPYLESRSKDYIRDDRMNFTKKKECRLYLYVQNDGVFFDLDKIPVCTIEDLEGNKREYPVTRQERGIYYATINDTATYCSNEGFYNDVWSKIKINNIIEEDIEMEFYASDKTCINCCAKPTGILEPSVYGIDDNEILSRDQIRSVHVRYRLPYQGHYEYLNDTFYRIYMIEGKKREMTIIDWDGINNNGNDNYFNIRTSDYPTGKYFVDIKVNRNNETRVFKNVLTFNIENDITNIYH